MWRGSRIYLLAKVVHWDRPYCIFDSVSVSQRRLNRYINRALHYLACLLCTKAVANALSKGSLPVCPYNCRFPLFTETSSLSLIRRCNRHLHSNYQSRCELHASGHNQLTLGGEGITKFNRLPCGRTESTSQIQTRSHPHTERKRLKVYSGKLKTKTRKHTHILHTCTPPTPHG